jgi:hypothetical protein
VILICSPSISVIRDPDAIVPSRGTPQFLTNILTDGGDKVVDVDVVVAPHLINVAGCDVATLAEPTQDADGGRLRPLPTGESRQSIGTPAPDARPPIAVTQYEAVRREHLLVHPAFRDMIVEQGVT